MNINSIKFDGKDVIKLIGFVVVTLSMWYDLRNKIDLHIKDYEYLEKRVNEMSSNLAVSTFRPYAVLPKETRIENEP